MDKILKVKKYFNKFQIKNIFFKNQHLLLSPTLFKSKTSPNQTVLGKGDKVVIILCHIYINSNTWPIALNAVQHSSVTTYLSLTYLPFQISLYNGLKIHESPPSSNHHFYCTRNQNPSGRFTCLQQSHFLA